MVVAASAQAQTNACDLLKAELAARFESTGVRGYTLEAVPAGAPVPADAKVIGNCEAGAFKVLFSRRGSASAPSGAASASARVASAAAPASAAKAVVVPDEPVRRGPGVQSGRGILAPPMALAPRVAQPPAARSSAALATLPAPAQGSEKFPSAGAAGVGTGSAVDPPAVPPVPAPVDKAPEAGPPAAQQAPGFTAGNWRWIGGLLVLALAAWIWVWRAQRGAYDKSGLPRGPRL